MNCSQQGNYNAFSCLFRYLPKQTTKNLFFLIFKAVLEYQCVYIWMCRDQIC